MLSYDDTHRLFKTIIQESLELFGYILICFGAFKLRMQEDKAADPHATQMTG